jgi:hypothetical protein
LRAIRDRAARGRVKRGETQAASPCPCIKTWRFTVSVLLRPRRKCYVERLSRSKLSLWGVHPVKIASPVIVIGALVALAACSHTPPQPPPQPAPMITPAPPPPAEPYVVPSAPPPPPAHVVHHYMHHRHVVHHRVVHHHVVHHHVVHHHVVHHAAPAAGSAPPPASAAPPPMPAPMPSPPPSDTLPGPRPSPQH